jgi:hypothetical protein
VAKPRCMMRLRALSYSCSAMNSPCLKLQDKHTQLLMPARYPLLALILALMAGCATAPPASASAEPAINAQPAPAAPASDVLPNDKRMEQLWFGLRLIDRDIERVSRGAKREDVAAAKRIVMDYLPTLKSLGEDANLPPKLRAEAWRVRGFAGMNMNQLIILGGDPPDESIAMEALSNLESALALGAKGPNWTGDDQADINYMAGVVALNHVKDRKLAGRYWGRCAEQGHAGCLNIIAFALLRGDYGLPVDIETSVKYNKQVVAGGTRYQCAGHYSALMIASMIHFEGAVTLEGGVQYWLDIAQALRNEAAKRSEKPAICATVDTIATYHLLRKAAGKTVDQKLSADLDLALTNPAEGRFEGLVKVLLGKLDDDKLESTFPENLSVDRRCDALFVAAWHHGLNGDMQRSAYFRSRLEAIVTDSTACSLAQRRLARGAESGRGRYF